MYSYKTSLPPTWVRRIHLKPGLPPMVTRLSTMMSSLGGRKRSSPAPPKLMVADAASGIARAHAAERASAGAVRVGCQYPGLSNVTELPTTVTHRPASAVCDAVSVPTNQGVGIIPAAAVRAADVAAAASVPATQGVGVMPAATVRDAEVAAAASVPAAQGVGADAVAVARAAEVGPAASVPAAHRVDAGEFTAVGVAIAEAPTASAGVADGRLDAAPHDGLSQLTRVESRSKRRTTPARFMTRNPWVRSRAQRSGRKSVDVLSVYRPWPPTARPERRPRMMDGTTLLGGRLNPGMPPGPDRMRPPSRPTLPAPLPPSAEPGS